MDLGELEQSQVDDIIKGFVSLSCKIVELEVKSQAKGVPPLKRYRDRVIAFTRGLIQSTKSKLDPAMAVDFHAKADTAMDHLAGGLWFEVEDKIKGYYKSLSRDIK
ncbi:MAG: hypothetical protein NTY03_05805 [Candidatus Bathyarchaeota archaeon]|nr:hypothetical protein [Candidatus Bathyarchaeota archaeon]